MKRNGWALFMVVLFLCIVGTGVTAAMSLRPLEPSADVPIFGQVSPTEQRLRDRVQFDIQNGLAELTEDELARNANIRFYWAAVQNDPCNKDARKGLAKNLGGLMAQTIAYFQGDNEESRYKHKLYLAQNKDVLDIWTEAFMGGYFNRDDLPRKNRKIIGTDYTYDDACKADEEQNG